MDLSHRWSPDDWLRGQKVISVLLVLAAWQLLGASVPSYVFPDLMETGQAIVVVFTGAAEFSPTQHIPITFARILLTFLITVPIGVAIGIAMGLNWSADAFFSPYVLFSLAFPSIVWAFLAAIWFGLTTYLLPVFVGFMITAPYVVINVWEGTKDVDHDLLEMALAYNSNRWLVWRYIIIPHLRPYTYAMMRVVLAVAWKIMLVAEIFGTQSGLGFVINEYFLLKRNDMIIAWTLPVLVGVFVIERLLKLKEEQQYKWRPEVEAGTRGQIGGG